MELQYLGDWSVSFDWMCRLYNIFWFRSQKLWCHFCYFYIVDFVSLDAVCLLSDAASRLIHLHSPFGNFFVLSPTKKCYAFNNKKQWILATRPNNVFSNNCKSIIIIDYFLVLLRHILLIRLYNNPRFKNPIIIKVAFKTWSHQKWKQNLLF